MKRLFQWFIKTLAREVALETRRIQRLEAWANTNKQQIHKERAVAILLDAPVPSVETIYTAFNPKH